MPRYLANITITFRPETKDMRGIAMLGQVEAMENQSVTHVTHVTQGKYYQVILTESSETTARNQIERMCNTILTNPVIELYQFTLHELTPDAP